MLTLAQIDPERVAGAVVDRVIDHVHHLAFGLMPAEIRIIGEPSDLRLTARALATYAQRGLPVWDWTDSGMAADGLLAVISPLYSRAADGSLDHTAIDVVDDVDPDDEIGLVLVAAAARIRLDQGAAITVRELGALAGIGTHGVRVYTRSGELPIAEGGRGGVPARVAAEDAVRWLAARGVPGVGAERG